ncbi:MAG: hypothetical protein R2854_19200 [Caldilineaceae bacterium]
MGETDRGWNRRTPLQFTSVTLRRCSCCWAVLDATAVRRAAFSKTRGWRELATSIDAMAGLPPSQVRIAQNFPDPRSGTIAGPVAHVVLPPAPHGADSGSRAADLAAADVRRVVPNNRRPAGMARTSPAAAAGASVYAEVTAREVGVWPLFLYAGAPEDVPDAGGRSLRQRG